MLRLNLTEMVRGQFFIVKVYAVAWWLHGVASWKFQECQNRNAFGNQIPLEGLSKENLPKLTSPKGVQGQIPACPSLFCPLPSFLPFLLALDSAWWQEPWWNLVLRTHQRLCSGWGGVGGLVAVMTKWNPLGPVLRRHHTFSWWSANVLFLWKRQMHPLN